MPRFRVSFTARKAYLDGSIEVEAADKDAAIRKVEDVVPFGELIAATSNTDEEVDAWIDE